MAAMCKSSWYFHMLDWKSRVLLSCFTPAQKAKRDFVFGWKQLPVVTKSWLFTWPAALSFLCIKYSGTQPTQCYWQLLPTIETKMLNFSRVMAMSMMGGAYATHHIHRCFWGKCLTVMTAWDSPGIYLGGSASQHFTSAYRDRCFEYGLYIKIKVYAVSTVSREQFALEALLSRAITTL